MSPKLLSRWTRSPSRVFIIILFILVIFQLHNIRSQPAGNHFDGHAGKKYNPCDGLEGLDDIFVTLRTGTTEAPKKLPAHFATTLRCVPNYKLYSDYEEVIEGQPVYDVLDEVNPDIVATHPDFVYYNRLKGKGRDAFTAEEMAQWAAAKNTNGGRDSPGWRLDKWKFLPLADKALRIQPDAKWYVFIESDTYVLWKSLLAWLGHFDPSRPWYLGQQMQIGDVVFAYGGAGFVISQPALKKVVEHRNANLDHYDDFTAHHWAGDCVLGKALADVGVPLQWAFPTLSSEEPADTDFESGFGGPEKHPWCYYAASYHHLPPSEYSSFDSFEQNWYQTNTTLLRHKDVFYNYVQPRLAAERDDWDNHSEKEETTASSFEACRNACESDPKCMQFSVTGYACKTSSSLRLGRKASAAAQVKSGWVLSRVDAFIERMESACNGKDWVLP
ncbi:putative glycosyltransferase family 31 protein [Rosellinia necatrix]|uniref:N-acetylgalactosaminide beta-1,3-galactosyltransferase n=1 Tax=Rosellinia necatrix TaxID=77044 RepID=A0A1W2TUP2_ROSNE|nr:putative glycosyltransferase family 31 protein [Rosellinia necatrix]